MQQWIGESFLLSQKAVNLSPVCFCWKLHSVQVISGVRALLSFGGHVLRLDSCCLPLVDYNSTCWVFIWALFVVGSLIFTKRQNSSSCPQSEHLQAHICTSKCFHTTKQPSSVSALSVSVWCNLLFSVLRTRLFSGLTVGTIKRSEGSIYKTILREVRQGLDLLNYYVHWS